MLTFYFVNHGSFEALRVCLHLVMLTVICAGPNINGPNINRGISCILRDAVDVEG